MKKSIRLIKGDDSVSVTMGISIYSDIIEKEKLTVDIYSLHDNNLMLFEYIKGKKVRIKLYNSLEVKDKLEVISKEEGFQIHNV